MDGTSPRKRIETTGERKYWENLEKREQGREWSPLNSIAFVVLVGESPSSPPGFDPYPGEIYTPWLLITEGVFYWLEEWRNTHEDTDKVN